MKRTDSFHHEVAALIHNITSVYVERHAGKTFDGRARRGRLAPVSSDFQDAVAQFLIRLLPEEYQILVDYPVSYRVNDLSKARIIYPDIMIIKDEIAESIFELKIDLGYSPPDWLARRQKEFERILKAGSVTLSSLTRDHNGETRELKVSPDIKMVFIVLSALNDHGQLSNVKDTSNLFVLTGVWHPNNPRLSPENIRSFVGQVSADPANIQEWNRLRAFLHENFGPLK